MNEAEFYSAVSCTDFCERYYALCRRYPVQISDPPPCSRREVLQILTELGRTPWWDSRDKSYSFDRSLGTGILHLGFVLHSGNHVEFWFGEESGDRRIGSNFAVIANKAAAVVGHPVPSPAYPRPESHSLDDLRAILTELFKLSDLLLQIFE